MRSALRLASVGISVVLLTSGCGSQRTDDEIRVAAGLAPASAVGAPGQVSEAGLSPASPTGTLGAASEASADSSASPSPAADVPGAAPVASSGSATPIPGAAGRSASPSAAGTAATNAGAATKPGAAAAPKPPAGGGGTAPAPVPAGGAQPIVIGSVGTYSGIAGASISAGLVALQAWVQSVNATGGINGHPVRLLTGDDGADPARHQQLVQQFVEQREVKVFVYNADAVTGQASIRYLEQKRVPVIGSEGAGQWYYESPMHFPQTTMGIPLMKSWLRGAAELLVPQGKKKFGFVACQEIQFCADSARLWPQLAKDVGFELVYQSRVAFAQPNFTSECLGARNAGVEFFYIASDANSFSRVARDCKSVGYSPTYGLVSATIQDRQKDDPNLDGAIVPGPNVPWFFTANPEIQRFQETLARYTPGHTADGNSQLGWTAARLFEAALRASPDPTTSAGILEGLWSLKGETVGGTTYPKTFPRDQKAPEVSCWAQVVIKSGKFTSPDNGKYTCV